MEYHFAVKLFPCSGSNGLAKIFAKWNGILLRLSESIIYWNLIMDLNTFKLIPQKIPKAGFTIVKPPSIKRLWPLTYLASSLAK